MKFCNSCDGCYANSLDVRFTKSCDNDCPFCIERCGISGQQTNVEKLISSTLESKKKDILILGGEPLLKIEEVLAYVKGIREYVDNIYITTSLPITIDSHWNTFCEIMNYIDGLNVSLQHYNSIVNNQALNATSKHNRLELLSKICKNDDFANKVRVSINLVRGYIDTRLKLDVFLATMEILNVKHVKINELQHEPHLYVSFEELYSIKMKSPYAYGCQQNIRLKSHKDLKITLKRACFCVNENLDATFMDMCKAILKTTILKSKRSKNNNNNDFKVLYEDGTLMKGWQKVK